MPHNEAHLIVATESGGPILAALGLLFALTAALWRRLRSS